MRAAACLTLAFCVVICSARADILIGTNGDRLVGKVVQETVDEVVFDSEMAGRLTIPRSRISEIQRVSEAARSSQPTNQTPVVSLAARSLGATNMAWGPPGIGLDNSDWIQLKSGEWLKGRLKSLQDDKLEFDSDKLDLQEFDLEDVWQVYAPRQNEALFEPRTIIKGPVHITREQVLVGTSQEAQAFNRSGLIAVTPAGPRELNYWSGKLSAGMTLRSGNTEQTEFNVDAELIRRTPNTRFTLDYLANLAEVENQETANNSRVTAQFDFWLSRHLYLKVPFAEHYHDKLQNIAHRVTVGAGLGYELIDRHRVKWDLVVGPAYQQTWYDSVQPGDPDTSGAPGVIAQSLFDTKITRRVDFVSQYNLIVTPKENGGYTHHWQNTFEFELKRWLDLDVSFIWDRVSHPATSSEGTASKPDDFRTILSLGVNF